MSEDEVRSKTLGLADIGPFQLVKEEFTLEREPDGQIALYLNIRLKAFPATQPRQINFYEVTANAQVPPVPVTPVMTEDVPTGQFIADIPVMQYPAHLTYDIFKYAVKVIYAANGFNREITEDEFKELAVITLNNGLWIPSVWDTTPANKWAPPNPVLNFSGTSDPIGKMPYVLGEWFSFLGGYTPDISDVELFKSVLVKFNIMKP